MSAVLVNIIGVAVEPVECSEGDSSEVVKSDLQRGFGNGILKLNGRLFARPTLVAGDYEYHITSPAGDQSVGASAQGLPAPAPPALPLTPRCEISFFLVLSPDGEITGTAFAVTGDLLLTAGHCMKKSHQLYIAPVATKVVDPTTNRLVVHYPKGRVKVKVTAHNAATDYAVLKVVKERGPASPVCSLPLTPLSIYPAPPAMEDSVKAYYAYNARFFNEAVVPLMTGIGVHSYEKISFVSDHHIHIDRGQSHGSSGGPYIYNYNGVGLVVAIHLESENDVPDINATSIQSVDHDREIAKLSDTVSELSNSHSSFATGLTIASCTELCEFLRKEGVAI